MATMEGTGRTKTGGAVVGASLFAFHLYFTYCEARILK
jgi:hypothetical protein